MMRSETQSFLRSLPVWLQLFAAFWLALAIYWQWLAHSDGIFGEMWDTLPAFRGLGELGVIGIAQELLRKYALVHILAVPKLAFWIDFEWFGASGRFIRAASFLVSFACVWCLLRIAVRDFQRPVICTVLALLLFFNPLQTYVINWEVLIQHYLAILFALLAFRVGWQRRGLVLPCVLLLLSAFSCGSGIAAIAGFTFMWLVQWREGKTVSVLEVSGYAVFLLVMAWLLIPDANTGILLQNPNPFFWQAPNLLLQYLAFPFSAWGDCRWLGVLVLLSVAHSVWLCLIARNGSLSDHVLILFFGIACIIAIGRYKWMGIDADVSRYYVYIAPLWFFSALKLLQRKDIFSKAAVVFLLGGILAASLSAAVILGNYANKMEMAKVVALNGNSAHLAALREDALRSLPATLANSRDYLREYSMDIYYKTRREVVVTDAVCSVRQVSQTFTTKRQFVDYFLQEDVSNTASITRVYLTENNSKLIRYYGTAFAAVTHIAGWGIALRDVRLTDWPLLLPVQWLPAEKRRLFVHLPASVNPRDLQWWAEDSLGTFCRVVIDD